METVVVLGVPAVLSLYALFLSAHGLSMSTLLVVPIIAFFILPTIIAFERQDRNRKAITVLNIMLGAPFVGWVVYRVIALSQ
jgi:hypothetical protein